MLGLAYKGYIGDIKYSKADHCLYGHVLNLNQGVVSYEGTDLPELQSDFINAVEDLIDSNIKPERRQIDGMLILIINQENELNRVYGLN